jgi:hypothetical protein
MPKAPKSNNKPFTPICLFWYRILEGWYPLPNLPNGANGSTEREGYRVEGTRRQEKSTTLRL